ncbi:galactose-3-O-sulfotransferase 2-like isoform X2 [Mercenaria mercenaria]|uniref:galactose-3-O-sulfotransferase 2-like isoform X2 n=1 Tax=Mercenaria mercenaria TaxID=6596 RepID=UPI00234F9945|nr:galactose-3-O-sulfotransferase 2-like isoform X2 [Mercenaria mercenaria]XP_045205663.2 galactose-3-O-sulfotransferase 2-like isoform X2 [Mercenaria mercenaria]
MKFYLQRCLVPKFKLYSRWCRRMPTDAPWQMFVQVGKSRPFLLFVILVLLVFLFSHYVASSGGVGIVIAQFPAANNQLHSNQSVLNALYSDSLPNGDNVKDVKTNETVEKNTLRNVQEGLIVETNNGRKCSEKKFDVSFLKVHKAGSTTLMNIFLRFAIEHKLNIVLPRKSTGYGFNYLGYGETVSKNKIVPLPANETYNILCNHVVYNREAFHSIMPDDTVYVGIIREPVSHFTSAASYYGFYKHLRELSAGNLSQEKVVSEFLKNPLQTRIQTYFVYNRMSFDFGIPKLKFHDDTYVDKYIEEVDRDYSLVLILEHFQESLVLMKRILCWDTKDILYVPLNAMRNKPEFDLDSKDLENLRKWNSADFKLYEHFYKVFTIKVESQGNDLKEEVESFKIIQGEVITFCNKAVGQRNTTAIFTVPKTKWGESFTVTLKDCRLMMEPELPMMKRLIENAWSRYSASKAKKL